MRLGFHYHIPAEARDGDIWLPGYLGRFIDSLAMRVKRLDLFLHEPRSDEKDTLDYAVQSQNARLFSLGPRTSVPDRLLHAGQITAPLRKQRGELDALLIRGPSPLLPAMARAAGRLPLALLIVGDYQAGVDDLPKPRWRKELDRAFSWWNAQQQLFVAKRSLTFVNSHKLYNQMQQTIPHLIETRTTTLNESDFYIREDTCQHRPIHMLYTGRMDRAKGIMDILQTAIELNQEGEEIELDLVGSVEKGDPILDEVKTTATAAGLSKRVHYHGYHAVGPDLFQFYKQADIYVLASRSSEGFPRTIWEAMAHSLPVVATKVGSIPDYISDAAELVEPNNPQLLKAAVRDIINNSCKRKKYISKGLEIAKSNTLKIQTKKMIDEITTWVYELSNGYSSNR